MITHHSHFPQGSVVRIALAAAGLLAACQPLDTPAPPPAAPAAEVPATATTAPTRTPRPTVTTPPATATLPPTNTPLPSPTRTPDFAATRAAQATATADAVLADIDSQLQAFDLSTQTGRLGWLHDDLTIKVDTYGESRYATDFPKFKAADFVLQTDVTWHTSTGLAGCAVIFRSEPDFARGKQYLLYLMRLQGRPLWDIEYYAFGKFQRNVTGRILDAPALDSAQDATNRITLIVRGNKLTAYANGERLGAFTDSKLKEGGVAFMAWQESGETTCQFTNTWLWVLDE